MLSIKPVNILKDGLRIISNTPVPIQTSSENHDLLQSIDISIDRILQYFSASNWDDIYPELHSILKSTVKSKVDDPEMIPGLEVLATLYLDSDRAQQLLDDISQILSDIKKPIHRYTIEYFLQKALVYWMFTRPNEFAQQSGSDAKLTKTVSVLFDFIYSCNSDEKRRLSTWNLLGLLITLLPSYFGESDSLKVSKASKMRSSFKLHTSKKQNFFSALNTMISTSALESQSNELLIAATKHIIKAGSLLQALTPSSPIVSYSKSLYPVLLSQLFALPSKTSHIINVNLFQCTFVTSFSVLNTERLLKDLFPIIASKDDFMFCIPNILQGLINLRQVSVFTEYFDTIMNSIAPTLRSVLTDTTVQLRFFESQSNFTAELSRSNIYRNYADIICKSYTIFSYNYFYFTKDYTRYPNLKDDVVFMSLVQATLSSNSVVERKALDFILLFLDKERLLNLATHEINVENPEKILLTYLQCGSMAELHANRLIELDSNGENSISHLTLIKHVLEARCTIIEASKLDQVCNRDPTRLEPREQRKSVSSTIETAMYITLCSINTTVCTLSLEILKLLVQEAVLIEDLTNMSESVWSIMPNFDMHSEFASSTYVFTGSIAIQKRLYQFLQHIEMATPAIIAAWNCLILRWRNLTKSIISSTSVDRDIFKQWKSYAGFLCSVLSPHLVQSEQDRPRSVQGPNPLSPQQSYADISVNEYLSASSKEFLSEMISLLTFVKSPFLRETARDVLSRDTSHFSYHHIFKSLEVDIKSRLQDTSSTLFEQDFLLLEQSVQLLRSIATSNEESTNRVSVDMGALALTIVKCLDSLPVDERVIRLRIQYCSLFEFIAGHEHSLNMKHDISIRNEITSIFAVWLEKNLSSNFADDTLSTYSGSTSSKSIRKSSFHDSRERLEKNSICAIIKSYTVILKSLRLEPLEAIHEIHILEAKAQKFGTLFTLFLRILEKCRLEEDHAPGSLNLGERLSTVKNQTITCASHLLNANMDVGLKFVLPLGLKNDNFIRVSFITILDNLLSSETNEHSGFSDTQPYQDLAEFIVKNISVTLSLCDICPATEVDDFSKALLEIFEAKGKCLDLVNTLVTREVAKADAPLEILRRNCVATKILSLFAQNKGFEYLKSTLEPFLREMIENPELYVFELNPDKISDGESLDSNFNKCERTLKKLIGSLQRSVDDVPIELKHICNTIAVTVAPKFSGTKDNSITAISAFFFLRFICPALVTPEVNNLLETAPPKPVRRTLLSLAKIIQNMAFGSTSFVKLSIFKHHPGTYSPNSALIMQFLKNLSILSTEETEKSPSPSQVSNCEQKDIDVIHRFLYHHWEDVNHRMILDMRLNSKVTPNGSRSSFIDPRRSTISSEVEENELKLNHKLTTLVRNLGRPRSIKQNAPLITKDAFSLKLNNAPRLQELLTRNAHRDMTPIIEREVINDGITKDGMPLIVMNTRNYDKTNIDTELVLCRFFHVASKMWKQKYGIFVDCTGYSPANGFPMSARLISDMLITEDMIRNIHGISFLNVSSDYLPHLKSLVKHYCSGIFLNPSRIQYKFFTTTDIPTLFNERVLNLTPKTLGIVRDVRIIYNNVYRYNPTRNDVTQMALKLGNEYIQLRSQEAFHYVKTAPGYTNDIYHLSEIVNVYSSNTNSHPDEFTIQLSSFENRKIILHCSRRHDIIRALQNAMANLISTGAKNSHLVMSPERSFSALLNIAFSGLCSENSSTQGASYNLLASIQKRFSLKLGVTLEGGKGLKLPTNVFSLVQKISQAVATARPEVTFEMFRYLFEAFEITSPDRRQGILIYSIPWVKNLVSVVTKGGYNKQVEKSIALNTRKFLEISLTGDRDYMFLLHSVWPLILSEIKFVDIVLDEIIFLVAENEIQLGNQMDDIVSVLASNPTLDVCKVVMSRLKNITLVHKGTGTPLVKHSRWNEMVIHLTLLSALLFENPECVEEMFAELSLSVLLQISTGPYLHRMTVFNLVINMLQSFLYTDKCDEEKRKHLHTIWDELTGSKGSMIFGISEEMKSVDYDYPVTSLIFQIEACTTILTDMANSIVPHRMSSEYRPFLIQKLIKLGSQQYSSFQSRSILILGCVARVDVSDRDVTQILEFAAVAITNPGDPATKEELLTCLTFCISRVTDGLRLDSKYLPKLFWLAIAILSTRNMGIFNYALHLLQTTLKTLDEYGAFKNLPTIGHYFMGVKEAFKNEWMLLEKETHTVFSTESFDLQLCAVLLPGLESSITRAATLSVFESLLSVSARNSTQIRDSDTFDSNSLRDRTNSTTSIAQQHSNALAAAAASTTTGRYATNTVDEEVVTVSSSSMHFSTASATKFPSYMPYLIVLYLGSRTSAELRDYLWIAGFPDERIDNEIPVQIKNYLVSDKPEALISLYLCTLIFRSVSGNEENMDSRVLACLRHVGSMNSDVFFKVYFTARPKVQDIMDSGPSLTLLKAALEVAKSALSHMDDIGKKHYYLKEMDTILIEHGLKSLTSEYKCDQPKTSQQVLIQQQLKGRKFHEIGTLFTKIIALHTAAEDLASPSSVITEGFTF